MTKAAILIFGFLFTQLLTAQDKNEYLYSNHYYKISDIQVVEISDAEYEMEALDLSEPLIEIPIQIGPGQIGTNPSIPINPISPAKPSENGIAIASELIKLGKEVWNIISDNKPKVNISTDHISVVPLGVSEVNALSGWAKPKVTNYKVKFTNAFGMEVVNLVFRSIFSFGGSLNGEGAYIANATIVPAHLKVMWGYEFNASAFTGTALNYGTKDSPVAALEMHMNYKIDTIVNHSETTLSYIIDGKGNIDMLD